MHAELSEHNQPHLLVTMRVDLILHIYLIPNLMQSTILAQKKSLE